MASSLEHWSTLTDWIDDKPRLPHSFLYPICQFGVKTTLSVWKCKFESVEKCESRWSKVQYICDTIMLPLCLYRMIIQWNKCFCFMEQRWNSSYYAMTPQGCATIKLAFDAMIGREFVKVCCYSITHSSASPQSSRVSLALHRLPARPLQVWLTGPEQDGAPTSSSSPQSTLLLLGGV